MCSYCAGVLRLCFCICKKTGFLLTWLINATDYFDFFYPTVTDIVVYPTVTDIVVYPTLTDIVVYPTVTDIVVYLTATLWFILQ